MSSLKQFCSYIHSHLFSVPIFTSSGNAEIAAPVSYVHLNQPSGSRCGDLPSVSDDAKSRLLARGRLRLLFHSCSLVSLFQRDRSFACAVLRFSFAFLVLASPGARLTLWVRPTFRAQVAFQTTVPRNNFIDGIWIVTLVLTSASFLAVLAITFPFLAFLAAFAQTVHIHVV